MLLDEEPAHVCEEESSGSVVRVSISLQLGMGGREDVSETTKQRERDRIG